MNSDTLWLAGIFLTALLTFGPAVSNTYCFDDVFQVQSQVVPRTAGEWGRAAVAPWWPPDRMKNLWRPVTRLSVLAQKAVAGGASWPFYAFNVALHAGVCLLLFALARRLGFSLLAAGAGALIFAVHPIHVEPVHQVVGRAELLAAFWMLLGLILYSRFGLRDWRGWMIQPAVFALALGCKEHALIYPGLLALMEMRSRERQSPDWRCSPVRQSGDWRSQARAPHFWGLMLLLVLILIVFFWGKWMITGGVLESPKVVPFYENYLILMSFWQRVPAVLGVFGWAAARLVWPAGLSPDYSAFSLPFERGWGWGWSWVGLVLGAGAIGLMLRNALRGGRDWLLAAAGLGSYALVSNGPFTIGVAMAERLWYWPSAAACLGAGWLAARGWEGIPRQWRRVEVIGLAAVAAALAAVATRHGSDWRSPANLAAATVREFPRSWRGQSDSARACFVAGDYAGGVEHGRLATRILPGEADSWAGLGYNAMMLASSPGIDRAAAAAAVAEAEGAFRKALEIDPKLDQARKLLGILLKNAGRKE